MENVREAMRMRRHLRPNQKDNFELQTSESALAFWTKIKRLPGHRRASHCLRSGSWLARS